MQGQTFRGKKCTPKSPNWDLSVMETDVSGLDGINQCDGFVGYMLREPCPDTYYGKKRRCL